VNFLYEDIVHVLLNTIDSCINSATDRSGYVLERMFTKFSEITQCNGHYAVQGHSRSPILVPVESSYTTTFLPQKVSVYLQPLLRNRSRKLPNSVKIRSRSRSFKVTDFGANRKLICDFLLVINTNLASILHRFRDIAFDRPKIAIFSYPSCFNSADGGVPPGTISVKFYLDINR